MARKPVPGDVQATVLIKARRRCCICYGLHRDIAIKQGQIAHLDQDASNAAEDNLAFLCLAHHDEYDSTTRQSKNLTQAEVKAYREELNRDIVGLLDEGLVATHPFWRWLLAILGRSD